jgi:pilus assembly protein Flp/PilA
MELRRPGAGLRLCVSCLRPLPRLFEGNPSAELCRLRGYRAALSRPRGRNCHEATRKRGGVVRMGHRSHTIEGLLLRRIRENLKPYGKRPGMIFVFQKLYMKLYFLIGSEEGQDLVEYALVVALIAFGATAGMKALATGLGTAFSGISTKLGSYVS